MLIYAEGCFRVVLSVSLAVFAVIVWKYRCAIREQSDLEGDGCKDLFFACLCTPCSLCQMHNELESAVGDNNIRRV